MVALLDLYLGPLSQVTELVRRQLLREAEAESIRQAIEDAVKETGAPETSHSICLSHSGLDFAVRSGALVLLVVTGQLHRALFDLTLDQRVRSPKMSQYTEVHDAREMFRWFFVEFKGFTTRGADEELWWDGISAEHTPHEPWLAQQLRDHDELLPILDSWLNDSNWLQLWLDCQLEESMMVNNPRSEHPVISYSSAVATLNFAKVRSLGGLFPIPHKH